jgi:hypothetical protein
MADHRSHLQYLVHKDGKKDQILEFKSSDFSGTVTYNPVNDTFNVKGYAPKSSTLRYEAATPLWRNYSYAGSGLPYPDAEIAYDGTPNKGLVKLGIDGSFVITVAHPSEYYINQGKTLLKPHINIHLVEQKKDITLLIGDYFPCRSLTGLPNHPNRTIGR